MRTTITLDADVEKLIRREERAGRVFKDVINSSIRRGLTMPLEKQPAYQAEFPNIELSLRAGVAIPNANALADALEDEALIARMALGR